MGRKIIQNPNACPMRHSINLMGSKWKPLIVYLLNDRPVRFGKLYVLIGGISKKVLTDQLRELESDGIIDRVKYAEIPPRVEYSLTEKGKALIPIFLSLCKWSLTYMSDVELNDGREGKPLKEQ